jgi:TolB-like protein/tetratricopeptide (TPR) repeat protein
MALRAGARLGPYEIVGPLGAGGMGEVYRARDERLQRDVALKVLPGAVAGDPDRLARFEREARALARLSHPSILSIFDFGRAGETSYAVTELLDGVTLRERLGRERLSWQRSLEIAAAVADGLASAHGAGIVHRDLKPENLFLTRDGRVKILDFGLARLEPAPPAVGDATLSLAPACSTPGMVIGTVGYMAPEQVRAEPADARTDIFALGCVLFEMLAGRRAFKRETAAETMTAILKDPAPELGLPAAEVPAELGGIVGRCLEKNPDERVQSARDLAFSLREALRAGIGEARSARAGRRPVRRSLVIAAAVLVLAGAVAVWRTRLLGPKGGPPAPTAAERIAVLPFENQGTPDDAYFAAGVTEDIMTRLASLRGLAVISRTSAAQYAGTAKTTRQIGSELDVGYLLTGTVRWAHGQGAAERVRVTPQLIRVADDTSLWAKTYEFTLDDSFRIWSEIARSVVSELGLKLLEHVPGALEARPTGNMDAYQAFLRGRFLAGRPHFTQATWLTALGDYEQAVALDPGFALAWAELARAHARLIYFNYDLSPERRAQARRALDRARELAPASLEVKIAAGYCHLWAERDADAALAEFEAAAAGLPSNEEVQSAMAELFRMRGDWQRAIGAFELASSLSPRDGSAKVDVAETLWWMRRYAGSIAASDEAISLAPDEPWSYLTKVFALWSWKGLAGTAETRAALEQVPRDHEWADWSWFVQDEFEGRFDDAVRLMEAAPEEWIRIKIQAAPRVLFAATLRRSLGEEARARRGFETAARLLEAEVRAKPEDPRYHSSLGVAFAGLGRREDGEREGRRAVELLPLSRDAVYGIPYVIDLAHIYALLGQPKKAVEQLETLLSKPSWISVPWLEADPRWRLLRGDPAFEALLAKYAPKR